MFQTEGDDFIGQNSSLCETTRHFRDVARSDPESRTRVQIVVPISCD